MQPDTAASQMARKMEANQDQSQKTEEQDRPTGEQQSHQLNVRKTSWRSNFDQMAAGAGIYRGETYVDAYLSIRSFGDQPNYVEVLQDAKTKKGLPTDLNFAMDYCVGRDRDGGPNA